MGQLTEAAINTGVSAITSLLNAGTLELFEGGTGGTLIFQFNLNTPAFNTPSGGIAQINNPPNSTASNDTSAGGVDAFAYKQSNSTIVYSGANKSLTISAANQNAANNTFTFTAHGWQTNQLVALSGTLPTTTPQVNTTSNYWIIRQDANVLKLSDAFSGTEIDITSVSADDTFTITELPRAIVTASSGLPAEIILDTTDLQFTGGSSLLALTGVSFSGALGRFYFPST